MTRAEELAAFAVRAAFGDLSPEAKTELRIRILDALGCAIGALEGPPLSALRAHLEDFGGAPRVTLIGGGKTAPDRAALYNGALVRYLDYNDSYLAKGETCHPSDNLGAVLAAAEYTGARGDTLMTALAVAYQVQCRLSDVAPVRHKGFDHTTQGAYAVAAGVSRALGLDAEQTANAVAIAGTAFNALRVTRTGALSNWKGLASPNSAACALQAAFLAMRGVTGPLQVFEGNKGFMDAIAGPFELDWSKEDLERVRRTDLKKYNAEIHAQSAIEGALALKWEHGFTAEEIAAVEIDIFDVAYHIIGGGEEGSKLDISTKEEADHSLLYMVAAALLDDQLGVAQYRPARILRPDVQALLRRVKVRPDPEYSRRFPAEHACRITIRLAGGRALSREQSGYEGFHTRPMSWETVVRKFERLAQPYADAGLRERIAGAVARLEDLPVAELLGLLALVGKGG